MLSSLSIHRSWWLNMSLLFGQSKSASCLGQSLGQLPSATSLKEPMEASPFYNCTVQNSSLLSLILQENPEGIMLAVKCISPVVAMLYLLSAHWTALSHSPTQLRGGRCSTHS